MESGEGFLFPVLGLLAVFGYRANNDRRAEEEKALDHAEEIVEDERQNVQKLPDVELDQETDRRTRK